MNLILEKIRFLFEIIGMIIRLDDCTVILYFECMSIPLCILWTGIISILDEECLRPGDASDLTFLSKMNQLLHQHPHYLSHAKGDTKIKKTIDRNEFRLLHYAGEVTYSVEGFLDKNNDLLYRDLKEVMTSSSNRITKDVCASKCKSMAKIISDGYFKVSDCFFSSYSSSV